MRLPLLKLACFFSLLPLALLLAGCAPAAQATPTPNPNLAWAVSLQKFEVKDKLQSVETVNQYVGSSQVVHQQSPAKGNVFLILQITVAKQGASSTAFDWSQLTVQDSAGGSYARSSNDSFLEQYHYSPRMTGLQIVLGSNQGWVCYEIPASAASGKLTLTYAGAGSQQSLVIQK